MSKRYKDGDRLHAGAFNSLLNTVENLESDVNELKKKSLKDTWRPIKVDGTEILGSDTETDDLNLVPGDGVSISHDDNGNITITNTGGGTELYVKCQRVTQEEYDALISAGTIDEMTLYIIIAPTHVTATFVDWDGTILQSESVEYGAIPVYSGETPSRADDYDPIENLGTEYTFYDWEPYLQPITANTTFTAQYTERQFRYVTTDKYVRETRNGLDINKDYLLVGPGLSVTGELHLAINNVFNSSKVFETMATTIYTEQSFDTLQEFTISGATPTVFLGVYPDGEALYFKDRTDDGYIGSSTANTGSNYFQSKAHITGTDPSLELDSKFRWILDENMNLYNLTYGRVVRYNPDSPRFAPYKSGQNTAVLFYKVTEQTKEYINNGMLPMSFSTSNTEPVAYFDEYIEALPEDE